MTDDRMFEMSLRVGNWGASTMLPLHRRVTAIRAPPDEPGSVLRFENGLKAVPASLVAADLDRVSVAGPGGRYVLRVDRDSRLVDHAFFAEPDGPARDWELRLEGRAGLLVFYARTGVFPSAAVLEEVADRMRVGTRVD